MTTLRLDRVSKSFKERFFLNDLSLTVEPGEFMILVGPTGCGKSTVLRLVAGLDDVDCGAIYIGDREVTHLPPGKRDVAMVFQNYALYPHMTVAENLEFPLKLRGVGRRQRQERLLSVARMLGLDQLLSRYPRELSGGQRQRVALGRAMVREPKVFLFDEPLSNVDAITPATK